ncbi:MAG TPA: hypothetical protein PKH39_01935 [Woeseiaceae bacterium]|nr:hypothetical protein [Woeseiaceae bacterium]
MDGRLCTLLALIALAAVGQAQDEPAADGQLADQFEVNNYYAEQSRQISRSNADKLIEIDKVYRDAVKALSAENAKRTQAIFADNTAAHKSLADDGFEGGEREVEFNRIQTESQKLRAELSAWYGEQMEAIRKEHSAKRAAQQAATKVLYDQLHEQRNATLQRVLNGPVVLATLRPLVLPATDTPDAVDASGTDDASTAGTSEADGGGSDSDSDVAVTSDGLEVLRRADDEPSTIGTADDASDSGDDDDAPTLSDGAGGLEVLERAEEPSTTGSDAAEPDDVMPSGRGGIDLAGTVDLDRSDAPVPGLDVPDVDLPPERPLRAQVTRETAAEVNTRVAPNDFDIAIYAVESFKFEHLEFKNGTLRGDPLRIRMIIANRGAKTYAFGNNELLVELVEGVHDFSDGDVISSSRPLRTRGVLEFAIAAEHGIPVEVPVLRRDKRSAFKKLGAFARGVLSMGLKNAEYYGGSTPARIKPNVWYTVDIRLKTPREYDNVVENHGAYLHIRFDDQGSLLEREGPFFFEPPETITAEDNF